MIYVYDYTAKPLNSSLMFKHKDEVWVAVMLICTDEKTYLSINT